MTNDPRRRIIAVQCAILRLREARDHLALAGAPKALAKVRRALKSAEGAERHAIGLQYRIQERTNYYDVEISCPNPAQRRQIDVCP